MWGFVFTPFQISVFFHLQIFFFTLLLSMSLSHFSQGGGGGEEGVGGWG